METDAAAIRRRLAAIVRPDLEQLREELEHDTDSVRKAIASQMRLTGAYLSRRRKIDTDVGPQRSEREANRTALRLHNAKTGNILRERYSDAVQNAIGWLVVALSEAGHKDTTGGLINIAARRCLEPLTIHETEPEIAPADPIAELKAKLNRQWDQLDYAAACEGHAVRHIRHIERGQRSVTPAYRTQPAETPVVYGVKVSDPPVDKPTTIRPERQLTRRSVYVSFIAADRRPARPARPAREYFHGSWIESRIESHFAYGWGI
jgi:hypothetical protein